MCLRVKLGSKQKGKRVKPEFQQEVDCLRLLGRWMLLHFRENLFLMLSRQPLQQPPIEFLTLPADYAFHFGDALRRGQAGVGIVEEGADGENPLPQVAIYAGISQVLGEWFFASAFGVRLALPAKGARQVENVFIANVKYGDRLLVRFRDAQTVAGEQLLAMKRELVAVVFLFRHPMDYSYLHA